MQVTKRNGELEAVKFEKILKRIQRQSKDLKSIDPVEIAQKVIQGLYDKVTTAELDTLAIETAYTLSVRHPDFDKLALRLTISKLHKSTDSTFSEVMEKLYNVKDSYGKSKPAISPELYKFVKKHAHILDSKIEYNRDYNFDFFGFKTLEKSYLLKIDRKIVERPQHMWLRVACGIHMDDIDAALHTYEMLSTFQATHATPTLFNSGTIKNQLSSCFLIANKGDSINDIFDTVKECALISQSAGGIGFHVHNIRAKGSPIFGTGGTSNGLIPMLKVYNETARYVDQGGGKRKGSFACYLEPWHADVMDFLDLRKNNGKEELRARDLNLALWIPDLFFKRVKEESTWSLMDPNISKGLSDVYGEEFDKIYTKYETEGKFVKQIPARELWSKILESQIETGQPYLLAKDACNEKSNQKNLGTIKSSNLCSEIIEYSSPEETAICNLGSISLPAFVEGKKNKKTFNFHKLMETTKTLVDNLNKVIDIEYYPTESAKTSNLKHRPIGIGIQGLADVFALMKMPWESNEARQLNKDIAEAMYFAAMDASVSLAEKQGAYESFKGSPLSEGKFQFDLWNILPSDKYDWETLRARVIKSGARNSLLICSQPTASTSQIMGNTECFEPITSNIYKRSTLSGEFIQVNKYLVEDLIELNLWNESLKQKIIAAEGSIQNINEIPQNIKDLYKTVWEISQRTLIDMSADRGPFVCQSQSLNLYFKEPSFAKLTSAYFHGWSRGLKTLVYYTRTKTKGAQKFAIDVNIEKEMQAKSKEQVQEDEEGMACSLDNPESCIMCQ